MKTFSIRIEEDLFDKVEAARENKPRTDFIREVIEGYFLNLSSPKLNLPSPNLNLSSPELNLHEHKEDIGESSRELIIELELKDKIIESKDQTIKNLEHEVGFLIQDHTKISKKLEKYEDRLLMPSQEEQKDKPRWFEFWKK